MTWNDLRDTLAGRGLIEAAGSRGTSDAAVTGIAYDSRTVAAGQVFVALKGVHADGSAFVRQAIQRGAAAVVSERPAPADVAAPWAQVPDARLAMAVLAAA
jgi:UDP-N-acetylmuramoyl-L-alanyl-D-glutamate--2,6-diaminopimelate ligase